MSRTRTSTALVLSLLALFVAGCGSEKHENRLRPPAPILISAAITPKQISVSPSTAGAGPVTIVIQNLTGVAQRVTFASATQAAGGGVKLLRRQTGPIRPQATATLQANVKPGAYRVSVGGDAVAPATVLIGAERPSAQNDLMLP